MGCSSGRSISTVDDAYCESVIQLEKQIKAFDVLVNKLKDQTITNTTELESNSIKQQIDTLQVDINETILKTKDEITALPDNDDDDNNNSTNDIKRLNEEKFISLTTQYNHQSQTISEILKSKLSEHLYI